MDEQLDHTRERLAELYARWEQFGQLYDAVKYGAALILHGETWHSFLVFLVPVRHGTIRQDPLRAVYGNLVIVRGHFSVGEARTMLERVLEHNEVRLPDGIAATVGTRLEPGLIRRYGSHDRRFAVGYAGCEYPFHIRDNQRPSLPNGYVFGLEFPLYPHMYAAIDQLLGVRIANPGESELIALAPDYRARIDKVQLSASEAKVKIETPLGNEENVLGKVYYEDAHGQPHHGDLTFHNGQAALPIAGYPRRMIVLLLSRDGGDAIDNWSYDSAMPAQSGVEFETSEEDLINLINNGESDVLEFKRQLPSGEDLAITISGFANSGGGRILIGVNDDAEVVGCEAQKVKDRITQMVDSNCDPSPSVVVDIVTIRERQVIVIKVPEGENKPYVVSGKGPYVRSNATTRAATRYEIDQMYRAGGRITVPWG